MPKGFAVTSVDLYRSPLVVVTGVSGAGKTTVGQALAEALSVRFMDADGLHPPANLAKMAAAIALTDEDRFPWLRRVGEVLALSDRDGIVVACSALKVRYRDVIRAMAPRAFFVHLAASKEVLAPRVASRTDHFMPASLLQSQFDVLEPLTPEENGWQINAALAMKDLLEEVASAVLCAHTIAPSSSDSGVHFPTSDGNHSD